MHRGHLHMLLYEKVVERIGPEAVRMGCRVTSYRQNSDGSVSALVNPPKARPLNSGAPY